MLPKKKDKFDRRNQSPLIADQSVTDGIASTARRILRWRAGVPNTPSLNDAIQASFVRVQNLVIRGKNCQNRGHYGIVLNVIRELTRSENRNCRPARRTRPGSGRDIGVSDLRQVVKFEDFKRSWSSRAAASPLECAVAGEQSEAVRAAIASLPDDMRVLIEQEMGLRTRPDGDAPRSAAEHLRNHRRRRAAYALLRSQLAAFAPS